MRRWLLALCLLVPAVGAAQGPVSVTAEWSNALDADTFELARDGTVYPCARLSAVSCRASVPTGTATWRARGVWGGVAEAWSEPVVATVGGSAPGVPTIRLHLFAQSEARVNLADNFDADSSADWTNDGSSAYVRDTVNGELDPGSWDQDSRLRYSANTPGSLEHESQITVLTSASVRVVGPAARMSGTADDAYAVYMGAAGDILLARWNGGVRTAITSWGSAFTPGNFVSIRLATEGADTANVGISIWVQDHGSSSKPSDPGWLTGTAGYTYTDTNASRLDDAATHTGAGIGGRSNSVSGFDARLDYWKARAISDRASSGGGRHAALCLVGCG